MLVSEEASAESCDLVVHITKGRSVWTLMKVWAQLTAGVRQDAADMEILRSTHFSIDATPRQYVSIDGEAYIRTPFEVSVARQALLVIVPQENHELE